MNLHRLFDDYHVPSQITGARTFINVSCPYCDDRGFHLGIHLKELYCTCFKCGYHPFIPTICRILSITRSQYDALKKTYEGHSSLVARLSNKEPVVTLDYHFTPLTRAERRYIEKRHLDPDYLQEYYRIGSGGITGEFAYRIIIPFFNFQGKFVSYTGRAISATMELRYLHLAKDKCVCSPKESLYNINHCTKEKVFVVEGPMDAIRMGDDCVSVQGLQVTEAQVTELKNRFKEIYIAFDNEKPAQVQAEKLAVKLVSLGAKVSVVDILSDFNKKDPGDLMPREVKQIKKHFRFL